MHTYVQESFLKQICPLSSYKYFDINSCLAGYLCDDNYNINSQDNLRRVIRLTFLYIFDRCFCERYINKLITFWGNGFKKKEILLGAE